MKKIILTLVLLFTVLSLWCQTIRFKRIIEDTLSNMIWSVISLDTGYVLAGVTSINFVNSLVYEYVDLQGNHIWKKIYTDPSYELYDYKNCLIKTYDGNYMLALTKVNLNDNWRSIMLWKFDENFDTIWTKECYSDTLFIAAYGIVQTPDGGVGIVGLKEITDEDNQMLFIKTDNLGNYQWHRLYGGESSECAVTIANSPDGGYLIGGDTWSFGTGPYRQQWYVVKTDSMGNFQWNKTFGSNNLRDGGVNGIVTTQDSCFVLTGGIAVGKINDHEVYNGMIVKIPMYGPVIWQKEYVERRKSEEWNPDTVHCRFSYPIELSDGSLACLAWTKPYFDTFTSKLYKFNSNGDTLWTRSYDMSSYPVSDDEYLEALKTTSDNGFILSGWGYFGLMSPNMQMCAVKTDCNGFDSLALAAFTDSVAEYTVFFYNRSRYADSCIWNFGDGSPLLYAAVCDTVIHTYGDTGNYSVSLTAYSSCDFSEAATVGNTVNVSVNSIHKPVAARNFYKLCNNLNRGRFILIVENATSDISLIMYDITGKLVVSETISEQKNFRKEFDIETFPKGVYFLRITSAEFVKVEKVVVQ